MFSNYFVQKVSLLKKNLNLCSLNAVKNADVLFAGKINYSSSSSFSFFSSFCKKKLIDKNLDFARKTNINNNSITLFDFPKFFRQSLLSPVFFDVKKRFVSSSFLSSGLLKRKSKKRFFLSSSSSSAFSSYQSNGGIGGEEGGNKGGGGNKKNVRISKISAILVAMLGGVVGVGVYDFAFAKNLRGKNNFNSWDFEWDRNWRKMQMEEKKESKNLVEEEIKTEKEKEIDKKNDITKVKRRKATRQILLIRHGQYVMDKEDDNYKCLTELGKKQAKQTALRLKELLKGKNVVIIRHSNLKRAKETAQIISSEFPELNLVEESDLAEGIPEIPIPSSSSFKPSPETINKDRPRIDRAFEKIFYRADSPKENASNENEKFEIVVCHGNVIRYMFCRALQFPTFGWLRLATYNCGITWLSVDNGGYVSAREFEKI